ncbi:MAG: DNA-directed RNA polymerase subunit alpha, partial [Candidatus Komeilibacteria bacterium]|nr:DNA-directed RNA polymerase subunit alpha [Candidatus Komeilibacteria bacterium]
VLLASIPGSAVSAFKIKGIDHEFTAIPNVQEDVVEIILNLKRVRIKSFTGEPIIVNLSGQGQKVLTAGDIEKNPQIKVGNPEQVIATLTDAKAKLDMELTITNGRGYVTIEEREKEKVDIGTIMIDSLYSPVINVSFEVENVRVGQMTNYEKLVLKIETDGTVNGKEVMAEASQILTDHFAFVVKELGGQPMLETVATTKTEALPETEIAAKESDLEEEEAPLEGKKKRGRPKKTS